MDTSHPTSSDPHSPPSAGPDSRGPATPLQSLQGVLDDLQTGARARNTHRGYATSFGRFRAWGDAHGLTTLPAEATTVALYLAHLAVTNRKSSTAERSLSAISQTHARHGLPSPCASEVVRGALKGLRRRSGAGAIARRALDATEIALMVDTLPSDLTGIRDRAILTLAFGSGLRRSEIVALDISDVAPADGDALVITVRHSKTDQEGTGRRVRVRSRNDVTCPVRAIRAWLFATRIETGALFCGILRGGHLTQRRLNDKYLERLVKRAAEEAGIPTTGLSAHSLRSGFATDQAKSGVPERTIMRRLGHTDPAMTRRYIQWAEED